MKNRVPSDPERLEHILNAIEAIEAFIRNMTEEEFLGNIKTQSAVLYQFVIIGEAVASLSMELTERNPYTWHKPRSFRNFIAHEYYGIQLWVVWYTIKEQLPELKTLITKIQQS
ncbi:MAG: DUF86 domain-containing protein [Bacteroidales bacterium]